LESPLVSVVTPVFNGAEYLDECIASVVGQTYPNWRLVVVDNASTDSTPEIARRHARNDSRITYMRYEEGVDVNMNHNRAFNAVDPQSAFFKVVQADDWLYSNCLSEMVAVGSTSESIGVISAYQRWGDVVHLVGVPYGQNVFSGKAILRRTLLGGPNVTGNPTAVMYRTRVLTDRPDFFELGLAHADTEAAYRVLGGWDLGFVHQVLTYARRQPGSRIGRVERVTTGIAEDVLFLVRYGPTALGADYRRTLRNRLQHLVRFHLTQSLRLARLSDSEFFEFHAAAAEKIRDESGGDREVSLAMGFIDVLLRRRALMARSKRAEGTDRTGALT
jgi:glycosyltransferase involved in cell wall biosynthesis